MRNRYYCVKSWWDCLLGLWLRTIPHQMSLLEVSFITHPPPHGNTIFVFNMTLYNLTYLVTLEFLHLYYCGVLTRATRFWSESFCHYFLEWLGQVWDRDARKPLNSIIKCSGRSSKHLEYWNFTPKTWISTLLPEQKMHELGFFLLALQFYTWEVSKK